MENIFWDIEVLKLESVALEEDKVIEWRETLKKAIDASLIPLKAYADGEFLLIKKSFIMSILILFSL